MESSFMFLVYFMDCWLLHVLDPEKKLFMVIDLTETHPTYEVEKKHSAIAKRFQVCFCRFFNDIFGGWLVESTGWTSVYPFMGVHDLCTREESGVYCVHHALHM